jgi:hypothetical protein
LHLKFGLVARDDVPPFGWHGFGARVSGCSTLAFPNTSVTG